MKIITQKKCKYITEDTLLKCFRPSQITHVDKLTCGNGFTTTFLNLEPPPGKINIIIEPNRKTVISKEQDYIIKNSLGEDTIPSKWFYKDSFDNNFQDAKILVFVTDSFLNYKKQIEKIKDKIHFVLIDENHSLLIQSPFRKNLINFIPKIRKIIGEDAAFTTVTASPLLMSNVDIQIKQLENVSRAVNVFVKNNEKEALKDIRIILDCKEKVIVFTNDIEKIARLFDENNTLKAHFVVGSSLMRNIVERGQVVSQDIENTNLIICSSSGFEGWDLLENDFRLFYFEDRSNNETSFFIANFYQALNRARNGLKSAVLIRNELKENRNLYLNKNRIQIDKLDKTIERFVRQTDISIEQKQRNEYKSFNKFITYSQTENHSFELEVNYDLINLEKEKFINDNSNFWLNDYKNFFESRNITFTDLRAIPSRIGLHNLSRNVKNKNLLINAPLISELKLFDDFFFLKVETTDSHKKCYDIITRYIDRLNYKGDYAATITQIEILNILLNENEFNSIIEDLIKSYSINKIKQFGTEKAKEKIQSFELRIKNVLLELLQCFANKDLYFRENKVVFRDYNVLTQLGITELKMICNKIGIQFFEIDIRTCFARIIYALNGLKLPSDFYGIDKKNKMGINIHLNNFMLKKDVLSSEKRQKQSSQDKFKKYNFDKNVISFLMSKFFKTKFRGDVFNYLSFFEKKIIDKLTFELKENSIKSVFRRHDSVLIFDDNLNDFKFENFTFLDQNGWFDKVEINEKNDVENVANGTIILKKTQNFGFLVPRTSY